MRLSILIGCSLIYPVKGPKLFKCLGFPTGGTRIRMIVATIDEDMDDLTVWGEDLILNYWFPLGLESIEFVEFPGSNIQLRNRFILYYARDQTSSPPNSSIARLYNIHWMGNIIVVKCSKTIRNQIIQISWGDEHLVDIIVALYVEFTMKLNDLTDRL